MTTRSKSTQTYQWHRAVAGQSAPVSDGAKYRGAGLGGGTVGYGPGRMDRCFTLEEWHHVVVTHVAASATSRIHIDGRLNQERTSLLQEDQPGAPVLLGAKRLVSQCMAGYLEEVAIWGRVLTTEDIALLWNDDRGRPVAVEEREESPAGH